LPPPGADINSITRNGKDVKEVYTMTDAKERQTAEELYHKLSPDLKALFTAYINMNAAAMMMLISSMEKAEKEG